MRFKYSVTEPSQSELDKTNNAPLILGQTNFFMEFEVCFYRFKLEFELKPRS